MVLKVENKHSDISYFIETRRLIFRLWREDDIELARSLWGDQQVTRFITSQGKLTEEEIRQRLMQEIESDKKYGVQYWPVFLKTNNEHIGCCGLRIYDLSRNIHEIGVHIRSPFWKQGYATEALIAVMKYAFDVIGVDALFAGHNPHNTVSAHLLKKIGFHYTHGEYYAPTGQYHPSYLLTADEYCSIQGEI